MYICVYVFLQTKKKEIFNFKITSILRETHQKNPGYYFSNHSLIIYLFFTKQEACTARTSQCIGIDWLGFRATVRQPRIKHRSNGVRNCRHFNRPCEKNVLCVYATV